MPQNILSIADQASLETIAVHLGDDYRILPCATVEQAAATLDKERPDLIITDISALSSCLHLRLDRNRTDDEIPLLEDTNVDEFIGKPPSRTELRLRVHHLLSQARFAPSEEQLARAQRIELLGQMASGIIHDVNNMLSVISGYGSLLQQGRTADSARHLQTICASSKQASHLLNQIITFLKGGGSTIDFLDLNASISETSDVLSDILSKSIRLVVSPKSGLPKIRGNPNQMQQVIMNLCINARDAIPEDGGVITISSDVHVVDAGLMAHGREIPPGVYVTLQVRDTGHGMSPEVLANLFTPFFTTKGEGKGTGLGLITVHRIITSHNGYITVGSTPMIGTTFTCYFPIA
jgi:signal transduction histidine kinase